MTRWAFTLSEDLELPVLLRSVTRLSHARGNVRLDPLPRSQPRAHFETSRPRLAFPPVPRHKVLHEKLDRARAMMESSPYNFYRGPEKPRLLIITSGSGWMYSLEAVATLEMQDTVGLLKLSTTWPLPDNLVLSHLRQADAVLFVEEVDPFLENNVKELFAQHCMDLGLKRFYGKATGTVSSFGRNHPRDCHLRSRKVCSTSATKRDPRSMQRKPVRRWQSLFLPGRSGFVRGALTGPRTGQSRGPSPLTAGRGLFSETSGATALEWVPRGSFR